MTQVSEPDSMDGAPHPRDTLRLFGHDAAQAAFLDAFGTGRLHHGWMIAGPKGVGKATLAWRIARFLLAAPAPHDQGGSVLDALAPVPMDVPVPRSLDIAPDHPVVQRMAAGAEPRLFVLRRAFDADKGRLNTVITIDDVRRMKSFFELSVVDGGRRVALVDAADDMNTSAANALLKLLEEPPAGTTLLLVTHQPANVLPTIRSRCRVLRLAPLGAVDLAAALAGALSDAAPDAAEAAAISQLAGGSVGAAIGLAAQDGAALYARIIAIFATMPDVDREALLALADSLAGRDAQAQDRFGLTLDLLDQVLARLARTGAMMSPPPEACMDEARVLTRLSPNPAAGRAWARLAQNLGARVRTGRAVNLDPAALLLDMGLQIDAAATITTAGMGGQRDA